MPSPLLPHDYPKYPQALARALQAKARVHILRLQKLKEWVTIKLQGLVRKFLAITRCVTNNMFFMEFLNLIIIFLPEEF